MDLNVDLGEGFGAWRSADDEALLHLATSANVACGFHAGDPRTMARTVEQAAARGVAVGAHPSYPDLVGFGRRELVCSPEEIEADVLYQLGALSGFCRSAGVELQHVKPHGALYNVAQREPGVARAICAAVAHFDRGLKLLTLPGHELERAALNAGLAVAREGFADRGLTADGRLIPRGQTGAVLDGVAATAQALALARGGSVDSLCVHSDTPGAAAILGAVRHGLTAAGLQLTPFGRAD